MVLRQTTGLPPFSQVPLSCVPPCSRFLSCGLTDRLVNCSVVRPLLTLSSLDGIAESICLQRAFWSAFRSRRASSHHDERSTSLPLERITPPSLLSKNWNGLPGFVTRKC
jgi:hypothetical protein